MKTTEVASLPLARSTCSVAEGRAVSERLDMVSA
jgi:hypothetical protein